MPRAVAVFLVALLTSTPAWAAHTLDAVIYDPGTRVVQMVVIPDDDRELDDLAFNPKGMVQARVNHQDGADPIDQLIAAVPTVKGPKQLQIEIQAQAAVSAATVATAMKAAKAKVVAK